MVRDAASPLRRQVGEDPAFQRKVWAFQRAGWVAMGLLVALALLGVLGGGPFSTRDAASADGRLRLRYDAVLRQDAPARWHVRLPADAADLAILSGALPGIEVLNIEPMPSRQARDATSLRMQVGPSPAGALVSLTFQPSSPGPIEVEIESGGARLRLRSLVLP